jgi:hypothetical protein
MKLNIDPNWLLRMVEKENNSIVSVGGLVTRVEMNMGVEIQPDMRPSEWSRIFPLKDMRKFQVLAAGGRVRRRSSSEVFRRAITRCVASEVE